MMGGRKKGGYIGGHTVVTLSRSGYEAAMEKAAERAKARTRIEQERYDKERRQRLKKFKKPKRSPPVMKTLSPEELRQKYPEGVPQWVLGQSADEIDRIMRSWRRKHPRKT
jgi:hypothetical protein